MGTEETTKPRPPESRRRVAGASSPDGPDDGSDGESRIDGAWALLEVRSDRRNDVREEIGRGGMGTVYRLFDRALRREVAMKSTDAATQAELGVLLTEEAQIAGQLDHPHIVPVHDIGRGPDGTSVYFTMKLVRGVTLANQIEELHGRAWDDQAVERCIQVVLKVCDALAFSHSRGVVHRDVKPENVMVGSYGQVYLMDWGLAMLAPAASVSNSEDDRGAVTLFDGSQSSREGEIAGTPEYMAPEQLIGQSSLIDARTDVFGVGGLLYYLLTGQAPHARGEATFRPLPTEAVAPPQERSAWDQLPPELCRITRKALETRPEDRYQTVSELQGDLEQFLRGGGWFETRRYSAGALVVRQGDPAAEAYMIVEGRCEVLKEVDGETVHLREMGPGDVFGETAILTRAPRTATVRAKTAVEVKVVTAEAFEHEFDRRSWAGMFVRAIAERFRDVDQRFVGA